MSRPPIRIITIDVEDWFHLLEHEATANEEQWCRFQPRIERNVDLILDCLAEAGVRATFFCLGWVARNHKRVVQAIQAAGHEIGSHSDHHSLVHRLTPAQFQEDLVKSIRCLEDITGEKVRAYRSPGFSVTANSTWAFSLLAENGIEWDSSVFAARHSHGGLATFSRSPTIIQCGDVEMKQFPVVPAPLFGRDINFAGGGYFRLLPYALIHHLMGNSEYVMTYFHPRDFDPKQPIVPGLPPQRILKSYVGLRSSLKKFRMLLSDFKFVSVGAADKMIDWARQPKYFLPTSAVDREAGGFHAN
ncbi:polysaccharide deacetylase family protein [Bradyrhizobium guangdongense]